jgi:hypothetical protein
MTCLHPTTEDIFDTHGEKSAYIFFEDAKRALKPAFHLPAFKNTRVEKFVAGQEFFIVLCGTNISTTNTN